MILVSNPTKMHAIRKTYKVKQFPFALMFVRTDQSYVFLTRMFKILSCILLGQVLSPCGAASDVVESFV